MLGEENQMGPQIHLIKQHLPDELQVGSGANVDGFFGVLDEDGKNMWLARTVLYVIWKISNDNRQVFDWYPKGGCFLLPQIAMKPSLDTILTCFSLVGSLLLGHLSRWRAQIWDWLDPHESRNQGTQSGRHFPFVSHEQLPRFLFPIETLKHGDGMARFFFQEKKQLDTVQHWRASIRCLRRTWQFPVSCALARRVGSKHLKTDLLC